MVDERGPWLYTCLHLQMHSTLTPPDCSNATESRPEADSFPPEVDASDTVAAKTSPISAAESHNAVDGNRLVQEFSVSLIRAAGSWVRSLSACNISPPTVLFFLHCRIFCLAFT